VARVAADLAAGAEALVAARAAAGVVVVRADVAQAVADARARAADEIKMEIRTRGD